MSKRTKENKTATTTATNIRPSIPEIYQGLNRDTARLKTCIVVDVHEGYYRFDKPEACHIIKSAIHACWATFDKFSEEPKQTILTRHANLFGAEPPEGQDLVTTAVYTYYKMCDLAVDRTIVTPRAASGRVAKILNCVYTEGECVEGFADLKTPQALACVRIFRDTIRAKQDTDVKTAEDTKVPLPAEYIPRLTEAELQAAVANRASELKTRQDPWRIFQYYRANLISAKILRRS
jgi:hypothetical protein